MHFLDDGSAVLHHEVGHVEVEDELPRDHVTDTRDQGNGDPHRERAAKADPAASDGIAVGANAEVDQQE